MTSTALPDSGPFSYMRRLPAQKKLFKNPGIMTYKEILEKSHSYTYLFPIIGN